MAFSFLFLYPRARKRSFGNNFMKLCVGSDSPSFVCFYVSRNLAKSIKRGSNFSQFKVESRSAEDEEVREQKCDSFPDLQTVTVCETGLT